MVKRFDLVVFDWDGTLLDSAATIVFAIQAAARDLGVAIPPEERARHVIGLGLADALRVAVPDLEADQYPLMVERYRHHYLSRDQELALFAGAAELVRELEGRGHLLAVATGKSRLGLNRALAASGLGPHFHATRCADECFSKPHPQMLEELLDELGVVPERAVMIGDTTHDLQMARNAGVDALAVSYGAHGSAVLQEHGPLGTFARLEDLAEWLRLNG